MIHIEGKVVDIMPETSGVGKSGRQWRERAAVSCDISIDAHEYRGKFFNEIKGFGLKKV